MISCLKYALTTIFHSFDDESVNSVVNTAATHVRAYQNAILKSIHNARDGFRYAGDAMNILTRIINGTEAVTRITMFLGDMLELANQGHASSLGVSEMFRTTRSKLFQVRSFRFSCCSLGDTARSRSPG